LLLLYLHLLLLLSRFYIDCTTTRRLIWSLEIRVYLRIFSCRCWSWFRWRNRGNSPESWWLSFLDYIAWIIELVFLENADTLYHSIGCICIIIQSSSLPWWHLIRKFLCSFTKNIDLRLNGIISNICIHFLLTFTIAIINNSLAFDHNSSDDFILISTSDLVQIYRAFIQRFDFILSHFVCSAICAKRST